MIFLSSHSSCFRVIHCCLLVTCRLVLCGDMLRTFDSHNEDVLVLDVIDARRRKALVEHTSTYNTCILHK